MENIMFMKTGELPDNDLHTRYLHGVMPGQNLNSLYLYIVNIFQESNSSFIFWQIQFLSEVF